MRSIRFAASSALLAGLVAASCSSFDTPTSPAAPPAARDLGLSSALHYLACPVTTGGFAQGVIGPQGGTLRAAGFAIDFPAGAVRAPQAFTLTVVPGPVIDVEAHAVGHATYSFAAPVAITVDLATCASIPSSTRAYYFDSVTGSLLQDMGGVPDLSARTLTFRTPHFSGYTIVWGRSDSTSTSSASDSTSATNP